MLLTSIAASFAVSLAVCLLFLLHWRRRMRRSLEAEMMIGRIRSEIDEMIVELNRTADRNVTLLENRIGRLSALIERAEKIERVRERGAEKDAGVQRVYSELGRNRSISITVDDDREEGDQTDSQPAAEAAGAASGAAGGAAGGAAAGPVTGGAASGSGGEAAVGAAVGPVSPVTGGASAGPGGEAAVGPAGDAAAGLTGGPVVEAAAGSGSGAAGEAAAGGPAVQSGSAPISALQAAVQPAGSGVGVSAGRGARGVAENGVQGVAEGAAENAAGGGGGGALGISERAERVVRLYRRGESLQAIAESLSMNRGEVELIISLHGRKGASGQA